ncbi:MAG TPA: hypothetical protein VFU90_08990, partial [Candidatus Tumulicola sp.]|nr:hypothetical protein [Candidatus Tumulicola sp.]
CTLESGEWDRDYIPICRWQWTPPTYGCFGMGIAHELEGMQAAISQIVRNILRSIHLFAVPRVWIDKMAKVSVHTIDNDISVNQYTGPNPPIFSTPQAASPDIYQFLQWLIDLCYKQLGLSQLTAQSEKPAGLNSGVAMRTYQDVETQRFAIIGQRWERFHLEEAEIILDMASRMYAKGKSIAYDVPGRGFVETIDWKDVSMRRDQYDLEAFPTSLLPRTPEGQLQTVQEFLSSGLMPRDVALGQLRVPNLDAWIEDETASRDNINMCLSRIRDKGKYRSPNGIANIDQCVTMAMSAWLRADIDDTMDPKRVDMLLRFLDEALAIQASKNAPPAAPPGAPGAAPPPAVGQAPTPPPAPFAAAGTGSVMPAAA